MSEGIAPPTEPPPLLRVSSCLGFFIFHNRGLKTFTGFGLLMRVTILLSDQSQGASIEQFSDEKSDPHSYLI